jgi:hypothetical protein
MVNVIPAAAYRLKAGTLKYSGSGYSNIQINESTMQFEMVPANITVSAQFELTPVANINFAGFGDEKADLTKSTANYLSRNRGDILTVSVGAGLTIESWHLDGWPLTGTENSRQFNAAELSVGLHHVAVAVYYGAMPYSKEVDFQVIDGVQYSIQAGTMSNGTLSFSLASALEGMNILVTPNPATNYRLKAGSLKFSGGGHTNTPISGPPPYILTMPAGDVTVAAIFEQIPVMSILFTAFSDELVDLSLDSSNDLSQTAGDTITITVSGAGLSVQAWYLGDQLLEGTGNARQFRAIDFASLGHHYVTVAVKYGEVPYSKEVNFIVKH